MQICDYETDNYEPRLVKFFRQYLKCLASLKRSVDFPLGCGISWLMLVRWTIYVMGAEGEQ